VVVAFGPAAIEVASTFLVVARTGVRAVGWPINRHPNH
jgi:hypothetical protein